MPSVEPAFEEFHIFSILPECIDDEVLDTIARHDSLDSRLQVSQCSRIHIFF